MSLLMSPYSSSCARLSISLLWEVGLDFFARVVAIVLVVAGFFSSLSSWMVRRSSFSVGVARRLKSFRLLVFLRHSFVVSAVFVTAMKAMERARRACCMGMPREIMDWLFRGSQWAATVSPKVSRVSS